MLTRHLIGQKRLRLAEALAHQVMLAIQLNGLPSKTSELCGFRIEIQMAWDITRYTRARFYRCDCAIGSSRGMQFPANCRKRRMIIASRRRISSAESKSEARRSVPALRPQTLQEQNFWDALKGINRTLFRNSRFPQRLRRKANYGAPSALAGKSFTHIGQEALTNALEMRSRSATSKRGDPIRRKNFVWNFVTTAMGSKSKIDMTPV